MKISWDDPNTIFMLLIATLGILYTLLTGPFLGIFNYLQPLILISGVLSII